MSNNRLPNHVKKRLQYYDGQFLVVQDFQAEQNYHLDRQRHQNRLLRTPGILEGLDVEVNDDRKGIKLSSGTAVDYKGRLIIADDSLVFQGEHKSLGSDGKFEIGIGSYEEVTTLTLYIGYREVDAERDIPLDEEEQAREVQSSPRWEEQAVLEITDTTSNNKDSIQLCIINTNADGSIKNIVRQDFESYAGIKFGTDNLKIRRRHGSRLEITGNLSIQESLSVSRNLKVSGDVSIGSANSREKLSVDGGIITKSRGLTLISSNNEVDLNIDADQIASERNQLERQLSENLGALEQSLESISNSLLEMPSFWGGTGEETAAEMLIALLTEIGSSSVRYFDYNEARDSARTNLKTLKIKGIGEIDSSENLNIGAIQAILSDIKRVSEILPLLLDERQNTEDFTTGVFDYETLGITLNASNKEYLTQENLIFFQEAARNLETILEAVSEPLNAYKAIAKDIGAYGIGAREADSLVYDTHRYHRWRVGNEEKMSLDNLGTLSLLGALKCSSFGIEFIKAQKWDYVASDPTRNPRNISTIITHNFSSPVPVKVLIITHGHASSGTGGALDAPILIDNQIFAHRPPSTFGWGTGITHIQSTHPIQSFAFFEAEADTDYSIEWRLIARQSTPVRVAGAVMFLIKSPME